MKARFLAYSLVAILIGCDAKNDVADKDQSVIPVAWADSDVLVESAGDKLTYGDLERFASVVARNKRSFEKSAKVPDQKMRLVLMRRRFATFPGSRLLVREAHRRGLSYGERDLANKMKRYSAFPVRERDCAAELLKEDLIIGALRTQMLAQVERASDEHIRKRLKHISEYNLKATATNSATLAYLASVKTEILSGKVTFEAAALKHSEDDWVQQMGCEWGEFKVSELEDDEDLLRVVTGMKPQEISDPMAADNGYVILRLDAVKDGTYTLSRIFRRRVMMMEDESAEELQARYRKQVCEKRFNELVTRLLAENPPVYPKGTNVFEKIKKETAK